MQRSATAGYQLTLNFFSEAVIDGTVYEMCLFLLLQQTSCSVHLKLQYAEAHLLINSMAMMTCIFLCTYMYDVKLTNHIETTVYHL